LVVIAVEVPVSPIQNPFLLVKEKPEGKRPLGRPRHRWVDNIKMGLGEIGCSGMDWIDLAQDRD
jgi:hypothetical protein